MRNYIPYSIAAALCIVIVLKLNSPQEPAAPALGNVYDSTIAMIRDFAAHDDSLGFANKGEADRAWIDLDSCSALFIKYLDEDSVVHARRRSTGQDSALRDMLVDMRRVIRPVYTFDSLGRKKLCACVTFELGHGPIYPVLISDSTDLAPFFHHLAKIGKKDSCHAEMIIAPFLHNNFIVSYEGESDYVIGSKSLKATLGTAYPKAVNGDLSDEAPVKKSEFFTAIAERQRRLHTHKKQ
jgi:hypothetical protein